ncbi:MAG: Na+/H+ antiporter subunit E [Eubacteriaceae bacterium]|nr:Na+/H+ antiporter subunit E [Eubacteriaceae bacterium]
MTLFLYVFWIILCGRIDAEILLTGLAVTALAMAASRLFFGYTLRKDISVIGRIPLFSVYVFILFFQIVKANISVMRLILDKNKHTEPCMVTFRADLRTRLGRYLLANSITLTPGTITVGVEGDVYTVHCLDRSLLDTSRDAVLQKWIRRMEK